MLVINTSQQRKNVVIDTADGGQDGVHIQPRGRVTLPEGSKVNQNWLALNGQGIKIVADKADEPAPVRKAVTATASSSKSSAAEASTSNESSKG